MSARPHGLPEPLPEGEVVLWQGSPNPAALARRTFHVTMIAGYFAVLLLWLVGSGIWEGKPAAALLQTIAIVVPLALTALGILTAIAWLTARATTYTMTDKRVVLQIGIALPMSINIPFRIVTSADVRLFADGTGDIPLSLADDGRIAYLVLWPHVRPWHVKRPEPMLRAVPDAARVAEILSRALASAAGKAYARRVVAVELPDLKPGLAPPASAGMPS